MEEREEFSAGNGSKVVFERIHRDSFWGCNGSRPMHVRQFVTRRKIYWARRLRKPLCRLGFHVAEEDWYGTGMWATPLLPCEFYVCRHCRVYLWEKEEAYFRPECRARVWRRIFEREKLIAEAIEIINRGLSADEDA